MVLFPTRRDNTLDLFSTNRPSLVSRCTALPALGDHELVFVESSVTPKRRKPKATQDFSVENANIDNMKEECLVFQNQFTTKYTTSSPIQPMWADIKTCLLNILDRGVPSKVATTKYNQPWITKQVKRLTRQKKRIFNKARHSKKPKDFERYKVLKTTCRSACKKAYNDYVTNIISPESSSNPKRFWSFINSKKCDNAGVSPLKASNGISYSDSTTKANILNDQFSSVFNMNEDETTIKDKGSSPHSVMDPIIIHPDGIHKLLAGLQIHKACGPDEIPTRLLKVLADELTPVISLFFQASLNQGIIPEDWKKANVVPVFKKGDRNKAENYRPISLTSVTCKLLEHVICSSIMRHLDKHNILNDAQHGFRKRRSCATQLIQTIQDLAKSIESRDQVDVILLDFSKAFDRVPHLRLLHKLKFYGIENSTYAWIADFLNHRSQQVILDGATSRSSPVHPGSHKAACLGHCSFSSSSMTCLMLYHLNPRSSYLQMTASSTAKSRRRKMQLVFSMISINCRSGRKIG
ncbi:uncharacterized protein [Amphiura filiformis]|uniref:uncharacterized protein n=1 Tax=Amphiura filiformis TaxID=82378 RepID=UPI003B210F2E